MARARQDIPDLQPIREIVAGFPDFNGLETEDAFMEAGVDAMDALLTLGKLVVSLPRR